MKGLPSSRRSDLVGRALQGRQQRSAVGYVLLGSIDARRSRGELRQNRLRQCRLDESPLLEMAEAHGISPAVHLYLRDRSVDGPGTISRLTGSYHAAVRTHLMVLTDLSFLSRTFASLDVPWLVMKGPVLSEGIYRRPDLRSYTDVDVVVQATGLGPALTLLEAAGGRIVDDDWGLLARLGRGELRVLLPSGTLVDLHWHLISDRVVRRQLTVSMDGVFARRRTLSLRGQPVSALDPVDTIVHIAMHSCLSGGNRLLWMKDMEQCLVNQRFRWDEVVARAHEWSAGLLVATHLARTLQILSLPVPEGILEELARSRFWRSLVCGLDHLAPVERASGMRSMSRMVARATRRDQAASILELRRRSTAWLRGGAPTGTPFRATAQGPATSDIVQNPKWDRGTERRAFLKLIAEEEQGNRQTWT